MKTVLTIVLLLSPLFAICQYDTIFHPEKINILTVSIDFEDYSFTGASMNYYDCPTCTHDSIPYFIDYQAPSDFGSMTWNLSPTMDAIFSGTIIWMGTGSMSYPQLSSNTNAPFDDLGNSLPIPSTITYHDISGAQAQGNAETALAWDAVSRLRIVQLFDEDDYDVLCYLYAPTVGMFDPGPAKWVFFFYKNMSTASLAQKDLLDIDIYPNPATDRLNFSSNSSTPTYYRITDIQGKIIDENSTDTSNEISVEHLQSGVYFIAFNGENGESRKLKWVKQ